MLKIIFSKKIDIRNPKRLTKNNLFVKIFVESDKYWGINNDKIENILYQLHESFFIDYAIKNDDLIFRVAINCAIENTLNIGCKYGEKYYLYDIICLDYKNLKTNGDELELIQNTKYSKI